MLTTDRPRTKEIPPAATMRPWRALVIVVCALVIGSVLNAKGLKETADGLEPGWQRSVALEVTGALTDVAEFLGADNPRSWIEALRDGEEGIDLPAERTTFFTPTEEMPARLWIAGDSLIGSLGPSIVEQASATGLLEARWEIHYSTGVTRPELFDWVAHVTRELGGDPAEIVVFIIGANDAQPIRVAHGWAQYGTAEWLDEYETRVSELMAAMQARAASVYWLGQPVMRSEKASDRARTMNAIYERAANAYPSVVFIDTWHLIAPNGDYTDYLDLGDGPVRVRDSDGVHFSESGGSLIADSLLDVIRGDWIDQ